MEVLNVLIPLAGATPFFNNDDHPFPKPLVEVLGKPMIECLIENLNTISRRKRFIFVLRNEDCARFHLDDTIRLLAGEGTVIIRVSGTTKGALCTALLAIEHVAGSSPLLISNGDQIFLNGLAEQVDLLLQPSADGGCIVFPSVHPRWSYVKTDPDGFLLEAAEKRPISKTAIAGVYCFSSGDLFLSAAMSAIRSGASTSGSYFISAALNQLILENNRLLAAPIEGDQYVTFYSPQKIADYESSVRAKRVDNRIDRV